MIGSKASATCNSVKETTHNVWSCWVSMTEAEEDLVAYLWDKYKATVALYITTTTAIWCHHTHPTCLHTIVCQFIRTRTRPLPCGSALLSTVAICVSANGITHLGLGKAFNVGRDSLEAVFVVTALTYLMGYLDDDKSPNSL